MPSLDPLSLIYVNALVSVVLTVVLGVSRIGLRDAGRGVRTWIGGDLLLAAARALTAFGSIESGELVQRGLVNSASLALVGLVLHLDAVRRISGSGRSPARLAAHALGLVLLYAAPAFLLQSFSHRALWFHAMLAGMAALTLHALWPMRRWWGARLMGVVMLLAVALFIANAGRAVLGLPPINDAAAISVLVDLMIAMLLTAGFMLLLQEQLRERIERLVVTDALTGTLNRHGLMPLLEREMAAAQRHGRELSVTLFDLDHFKRVNDQHGHAMGDLVLAGFAARVHGQMRGGDLFGRWGGEEFLLVLPDTAAKQAAQVADRIRESVAQAPLAVGAPRVTVSGGIAEADQTTQGAESDAPHRTQDLLRLLDLADKRLYIAKQARNRVVAQTDVQTDVQTDATPGPQDR